MTKRPHFISFGPPIPQVPIKDFSTIKLGNKEWKAVWEICGPSVERNLSTNTPIWKVIAAAYLEGLSHGSGLTEEHMKRLDPLLNYKERTIR